MGCVHFVQSIHYETRTAVIAQTARHITGYSFHEPSPLKLNAARIVNRSVIKPSLGKRANISQIDGCSKSCKQTLGWTNFYEATL